MSGGYKSGNTGNQSTAATPRTDPYDADASTIRLSLGRSLRSANKAEIGAPYHSQLPFSQKDTDRLSILASRRYLERVTKPYLCNLAVASQEFLYSPTHKTTEPHRRRTRNFPARDGTLAVSAGDEPRQDYHRSVRSPPTATVPVELHQKLGPFVGVSAAIAASNSAKPAVTLP